MRKQSEFVEYIFSKIQDKISEKEFAHEKENFSVGGDSGEPFHSST